ncbi:NAD(P)/FAD-dependent oxidoreductase [Sinimarinibacterium sp. NLF-5-8]|uniref:NAD(P)/FAD-dependent oxidoreductase n=1 Tax=Sinimarinibacterium sp. NLF-5-8 TaxID=2698684 RepID=UPI00137BDF40|nr:NAD(P)/FAD-dependent oxidoreductase [Sinimarinibacterium sp. NLF-5-8]QHS10439.1 NAD(P)/FAD-dependent oxidoreductase [Sinimarinibacterium sp. NLF-5-8]
MSRFTDDVLILGGGAAGLMCARVAGQRGLRARVLEHANRVGKKILMSGGGRCNFTNLYTTPANYLCGNPHFCKSALARFTPQDFIELVERHRIAYHEKELGQLFCDESSKLIVRMLLEECADAGVTIHTDCSVSDVRAQNGGFALATAHGVFTAPKLVIASGGLSIPSMGASGFGYTLARQFGHRVLPTRAGLVPFTLSGSHKDAFADLAGVSTPVIARCNGQAFRNALLITHRGLSGPAMLQISSYWQPGDALTVDWLAGDDGMDWLHQQRQTRADAELKTVLAERFSKRFAQRLCDLALGNRPLRQLQTADLARIAAQLQNWPITPSGTEGYRTAEVTLGGVDTDEISSKTLESRLQPGLHLIGEVVDVTGHLGGFNFQWAWASAVAAGMAV